MDTVAEELKPIRARVVVPTSVPGLVTDRLLVMKYLDGVPLTQLGSKMSGYSDAQKKAGLTRVRCSC
jgi:predicted unusual protein kinase regulating ubiquinone biosynthesis (AarF/ABC1/UbiB family)